MLDGSKSRLYVLIGPTKKCSLQPLFVIVQTGRAILSSVLRSDLHDGDAGACHHLSSSQVMPVAYNSSTGHSDAIAHCLQLHLTENVGHLTVVIQPTSSHSP
ncbi:hypothetical protein TcWFU_008750 [Taenia crassiceps]|uniref:Uncharacterized protein n=1 Tax=Taenia crassiceps TaxID=6207 RepID=A0ABR4PZ86_9CEST